MLTTAPPLHTNDGAVHEDDGAVHKDDGGVHNDDGAVHKDDGAVQHNVLIICAQKTLNKSIFSGKKKKKSKYFKYTTKNTPLHAIKNC